MAKIECWLGSFMTFQGIPTSSSKETYSFVIFQGGWGSDSLSPTLGLHMEIIVHM